MGTKTCCDRCGADIAPNTSNEHHHYDMLPPWVHDTALTSPQLAEYFHGKTVTTATAWDVCAECTESFMTWWTAVCKRTGLDHRQDCPLKPEEPPY